MPPVLEWCVWVYQSHLYKDVYVFRLQTDERDVILLDKFSAQLSFNFSLDPLKNSMPNGLENMKAS